MTDAELREQLATLIRDWDTAVEYMLHDPHTELEDKLMQLIKARDAAKEREILEYVYPYFKRPSMYSIEKWRSDISQRIEKLRRESDLVRPKGESDG